MSTTLTKQLLEELESERVKFTRSYPEKMEEIINRLIELKVYPSKSDVGLPASKMVEYYGVNWHIYTEPLSCDKCKYDFRDLESGPPFKKELAVYDQMADRTIYYMCPNCGKNIERK